jgi:hypothetical protein
MQMAENEKAKAEAGYSFLYPILIGCHDLSRPEAVIGRNLLILNWWRRGESNPRPKKPEMKRLRA